jgi:CPA1 family monovalent cation:H+ antiporter
LTLLIAYGGFALATALGLSGVLVTVVAAMIVGERVRASSADTARRLDGAWRSIAFALSGVTFLAIGISIDLRSVLDAASAIAAGVAAVIAARAVFVYVPFAVFRPRVPAAWVHVLFVSGLRGAIAFAATLSLPLVLPERLLVQDISFGIVLVTLVAQGIAAPIVIQALLANKTESVISRQ